MTYKTREEWLNAFMKAARPVFKKHGSPIPKKVRVSIGFSSKGSKSSRIGECWSSICSGDETFEIFIEPGQHEPARIAGILTHELVHAAVGLQAGHGPVFRKLAVALGLTGKMTATTEGELWHAWADAIIKTLGKIPHASLRDPGGRLQRSAPSPDGGGGDPEIRTTAGPTQKNRQLKLECTACGFICRASNSTIERVEEQGGLICVDPTCDGDLVRA
jgi:hypothetical protein